MMFLKFQQKALWVLALIGLMCGAEASLTTMKASSQVINSDGNFQLSPFVSTVLPFTFLEPTFFGPQSVIGDVGEYHRFIILAESYKQLAIYRDFEYASEEQEDYDFIIGQRYKYE